MNFRCLTVVCCELINWATSISQARNPNMAPLEAITMREAEVTSDAELQYGTGFGEELVPGLPRFEEFLRVGDIDELQRQQMPALTHVPTDPTQHDQRLSDLQLPAALPPPQISCAVDLLQLGAEWDQSCSQVEPDQSLHKEVGDNAPGNKLKRRLTSSDQSQSSAGGSRPKLSTPTSPIQLPSVLVGADSSVDPASHAVEELLLPPLVEVASPSDATAMPPPADIPPSCRSPVVGQSEPVQTVDVLETNTLSDSCLLPSNRGAPAVTPSITGPPAAQHPPPVVSRRVPPVADVTIQEELEQQQRQSSFELPSQVTPPLRLPRSRRLRIDAHTEISRDVTRDRIQSMATDTMRAMSATEDNILPPSQRIVPALSLLSSSTRHLSSVLNRLHSRHCVVQQADYFDWLQDSADDVEKQRLAQSNLLTSSSNVPSCLKRSDEASALSVTTINQTANQTLGVIQECGDGDAAVAIDNVTLLAPANPAIAEELEELPVDPQLLERVDGQVDVGSGGQTVLDNLEHPPIADVVPSENLTSAQSDASSSDIYRHSLVPDCLLSHDSSPLDGPLLFSSLCDTSSCSRRQAAATFSHLLHLHAVGRLRLQQTQCYAPISITSLPSVS